MNERELSFKEWWAYGGKQKIEMFDISDSKEIYEMVKEIWLKGFDSGFWVGSEETKRLFK